MPNVGRARSANPAFVTNTTDHSVQNYDTRSQDGAVSCAGPPRSEELRGAGRGKGPWPQAPVSAFTGPSRSHGYIQLLKHTTCGVRLPLIPLNVLGALETTQCTSLQLDVWCAGVPTVASGAVGSP
jgi:hypothetical protein